MIMVEKEINGMLAKMSLEDLRKYSKQQKLQKQKTEPSIVTRSGERVPYEDPNKLRE